MIIRVLTEWTGMILSRKTLPLIALCILVYLYRMRNFRKVYKTYPRIQSQIFNNISHDNALYADFMKTWCLVQTMKTDWKQVLQPCAGRMAWEVNAGEWDPHDRTDTAKSYLIRWDIRPAGQFSRFDIQSVTKDNVDKRIGGDSWRVHIRGPSSLSPTVIDHDNGKYQVSFLVLEPGRYEVEVVLEYSLCEGYKDPPKDWFIKG